LTPSGLIARAVLGVLVFTVLHAVGFRAYTTILSGTSPTGEQVAYVDMLKMVAYVLSYLFSTIIAPILLIAAALLTVLQRKLVKSGRLSSETDSGSESPETTVGDEPQTERASES
jgi:hypothetical protein